MEEFIENMKVKIPQPMHQVIKNIWNELSKNYTFDTIKTVTEDEKTLICTAVTGGKIRKDYVDTLECLGVDCKSLKYNKDEYTNFSLKWKEKFSRHGVISIFNQYYMPLLAKFDKKDMEDGKISADDILKYCLSFKRKNMSTYVKIFSIMELPEELYSVLCSILTDKSTQCDMYSDFIRYCKDNYTEYQKSHRYAQKEYDSHMGSLLEITTEELIPDLSIEECKKYAYSPIVRSYVIYKLYLLDYLGSPHAKKLLEDNDSLLEHSKFIDSLAEDIGVTVKSFRLAIDLMPHEIETMHSISPKDMLKSLDKMKSGKVVIGQLYIHMLEKYNMVDEIQEYYDSCPAKLLPACIVDVFKKQSKWRDELMIDCMKQHNTRIQNSSAYEDKLHKKIAYTTVSCLKYIEKYTIKLYKDRNNDVDPIRWFISMCTINMVEDLILAYGKEAPCDNSRVKSAINIHHAKKLVSNMIVLFKTTINHLLQCKVQVRSLIPSMFTSKIENLRIEHDSNVRRTYNDDEISKLLNVASSDSRLFLLITILREIGLRLGAICNLKYTDIIENNTPKHICKVLEKGKQYREFITSTNLKKAIASYIMYVQTHPIMKHHDISDIYVFNNTTVTRPVNDSTISAQLKNLATQANITDVEVHMHSFRHTIVGKLMDAGNDIQTVSKFIGHSSIDTTNKHYWLRNITDLQDSLKNPFFGSYRGEEEKKAEYEESLERAEKKIDTAMSIIHVYQSNISEGLKDGLSVQEIQNKIFSTIPTLDKILRVIADSVAGSETSYTTSYYEQDTIKDFI